jgi:subtilisin family serine protease
MKHSKTLFRWHAGWVGMTAVVLLIGLAVFALTFSATLAQPASPAIEPVVASTEPYIEYAPNTLLLKLKPGVTLASGQVNAAGASVASSAESLNTLLSALGATSAEPVFARNGVNAMQTRRSGATGLESIYRVQWTSTIPVKHAVAALAADAAVEYAEPDYIARPARVPNDPEYANQWALAKINAPTAWDVTTGDANVIIAIVDSGVDATHPDFADRLWVNDDPVNGVDDDLNGKVDDLNGWNVFANNSDISDLNGHGSEVGGVAGAATNNGAGVAGICWNCSLMFVNAMQANNVANYSDIAVAVQYAASNGAQVINLSLGGYADSAVLRDAVREAAITALIVGGAGNDDSSNPFYPAAYPEVLAVAATDANDQKAVFSNYGAWVDVSAPGRDIRTTTVGGYATGSGSSLSAPFVAGLAGLIRSQQPAWTPEQVRWQILNTAVNTDGLNPTRAGQLGQGRIDAGAALATAPQARATVEGYALDGQANVRPAPGQAFQLVLNVRNLWLLGQNLQGTLTSSDPYVTITAAEGAFGDIAPGQLGSNSGAPFGVTVAAGAPYNHPLQFTLNLSGAGGYSLAVPFAVQVRSSVETLGNTIYSQNTTWTSDKTYILNGSVIVNTGVTLTIQPGTVIKANPGKFIRVDGTLIARGTVELPILFTTNSITNATWSGIRFADTAVDASYDDLGAYLAGSVLQFVEISYGDIAASLNTRAPYIADSRFTNNSTSLQVGNNNNGGAPHIERNSFTGGNGMYGAIALSGGQPLIQHNTFDGGLAGIGNYMMMSSSGGPSILYNTFRNGGAPISVSGSPTIIGNVIQNNTGTAISAGGAPVIRDNVIVGNGGGISGSRLQLVDIEHNLIANNGGVCSTPPCGSSVAAVMLDVEPSGFSQSSPALAYNSVQDEYLAVWVEDTASGVVKALRLAGDGQPIDGEIVVSGPPIIAGIGPAHVVYQPSQNRYFVVWAGMAGVSGRFVTANGQSSGDVLSIFTSRDANAVRVSYLPSEDAFLVGYHASINNPCCWQRIYAQRLTSTGVLNGSAVVIGNDLGGNVYLGDIAVDPATDKAIVVFHADNGNQRIWGAWIEPATHVVSSTVIVDDTEWLQAKRPSVAFGPGINRFAMVWERHPGWSECCDPRGLMVQPINADSSLPISPTIVISDASQASTPRVAFGSTPAEFMTVWVYGATSATPAFHTLHARRIDGNGALVGTSLLISTPASGASGIWMAVPAIAYNSQRNEYLVVWVDNRTGAYSIWAQRINATGQLLDNAWTPTDETNPANNFRISQVRGVRYNTIIHNTGYGIQLGGQAAASVTIANNNLFGNGTYDLYLTGGQVGTQNFTVNAANNFWNVDASQIPNRIRDCTFDDNGCGTASSTVGQVAYNPPLVTPDQTAPAYVRSVTMNPNPVGLERGVVTLDFSKPMSVTALPVASFHDARRGTTQQVFSDTAAYVMSTDIFGRVWFGLNGMYSGGSSVRMYDGHHWATYTNANSGLSGAHVSAMFGASNGDIWFALGAGSPWLLSRLQGTTWYTYTGNLPDGNRLVGDVMSIDEDGQGAIWFGGANGTTRYDGSTWRRFTTADGLADNYVRQIARDGQGRMWFLAGTGGTGSGHGINVYDGVSWTTFGEADGLPPAMYLSTLFADSLGRIWVGYGWYDAVWTGSKAVAMFDGAGWHFFGSAETNNHLNCAVNGIAETPDGTLWFSSCGRIVTYDGVTWSISSIGGFNYPFTFDSRGNLWYNSSGLTVHWGGIDYPFTDGQWLSATRFQAGYDFDANIAPGFYEVQVDGAVSSDGMVAYAGSSSTFQVDFGAVSRWIHRRRPRSRPRPMAASTT